MTASGGERAPAGDDDPRDRVLALAALDAESVSLDDALSPLAEYALDAVPGADGVALTLVEGVLRRHSLATIASVQAAEELQYTLQQGPSVAAVVRSSVIVSGALTADRTWPRFAARVGRLGLRSALAVPLAVRDETVGVLSFYAARLRAFGDDDVAVVVPHAELVAVVARNAQLLAISRSRAAQLDEALRVRPVIDQAIGILRSRRGTNAQEAFEQLRRYSNDGQIKVAEVAQRIVDSAVARANARRRQDAPG